MEELCLPIHPHVLQSLQLCPCEAKATVGGRFTPWGEVHARRLFILLGHEEGREHFICLTAQSRNPEWPSSLLQERSPLHVWVVGALLSAQQCKP